MTTSPNGRSGEAQEHECTSWLAMPNLTGGKYMLLHKNRDSKAKQIILNLGAPKGKNSWIAVSSPGLKGVNVGVNTRGLAVAMNSGDLTDGKSYKPGLETVLIAKNMLENCADAAEAEAYLHQLFEAKNYHHRERGSIWFMADAKHAIVAENDLRRYAAHEVSGGFAVRANVWHYPEMIPYTQRTQKQLIENLWRECCVRDTIFETGAAYAEPVTVAKFAAASRQDKIEGMANVLPVCARRTVCAVTIAIDCEYPEQLTTMYATFGPPQFTAYLPIPTIRRNFAPELLEPTFGDAIFARRDAGRELLPPDELTAFEAEMNRRHAKAVEQARAVLKKGGPIARAKKFLDAAFEQNWEALRDLSAGK
ncbi:MAG: hypothetical protein IJS14_14825 [Lentisphaeria bacterium]|nr:hypothetical protein [Lentisphaeria bacterium]